jgi:small-conductance mechanosensitive channel
MDRFSAGLLEAAVAVFAPPAIASHVHRLVLGSFVLSGLLLGSFAVYWIVFRLILRRKVSPRNHQTIQRFRKPAVWMFLIASLMMAVPSFELSPGLDDLIQHGLHICFILGLAWILFTCVYAVQDVVMHRYDITAADNLRARRVQTQMTVLRRLAFGMIGILALGLILYTFHHTRLWQAGAGLLASAGLATLVLATAAKSTVSNLLAGIQIAFTEPIRLDDVVIVDGQWGRIEEITTAYVVVCIWNLQRLIVPLSYFIENPFQNWTRQSANLMGTFFLYTDYTCPIEPLRDELTKILKSTALWDGKVNVLQVTELTPQAMQIRALMSAADSSKLWDLRCYVREKMIAFVQQNYPQCLPKQRINELQHAPWAEIALPGSEGSPR